jgi:hypothetical protein
MAKTHDPRDAGPKPPFPQQPQTHPGAVRLMDPPADHGERPTKAQASYKVEWPLSTVEILGLAVLWP